MDKAKLMTILTDMLVQAEEDIQEWRGLGMQSLVDRSVGEREAIKAVITAVMEVK